ncbi:MAG: S41 family peptidase, partial [Bacteroidales bacterium]
LINCLKTVMNVVVIGQKTEGSVAQACESFHDLNRDQLLRLVVCELTDANGESSYTGSGFTPDYSAEPFNPIEGIQPYGSPSENLFAKALSVIAGEEE